jgi:hypothetical protein
VEREGEGQGVNSKNNEAGEEAAEAAADQLWGLELDKVATLGCEVRLWRACAVTGSEAAMRRSMAPGAPAIPGSLPDHSALSAGSLSPPGALGGAHCHPQESPPRGTHDPAADRGGQAGGPGRLGWGRAEGTCTYLFLALGRAGYAGCGPAWHSSTPPRASSASAQRQGARGKGRVACHMVRAGPESGDPGERTRLPAAGRRGGRQELAPQPLLAPSSPFALASPRSLNDAQVPPGCRPLYFTSLSET